MSGSVRLRHGLFTAAIGGYHGTWCRRHSMTLNSMPKASAFWMILFSVVLAYSPAATAQVSTWMGTGPLDFGILKWSTSAVCFGPPWAQQTSTLYRSEERGVG